MRIYYEWQESRRHYIANNDLHKIQAGFTTKTTFSPMHQLNNAPTIGKELPGVGRRKATYLTPDELARLFNVIPRHSPLSARPKSIPNNLWLARKRLGLSQKWVASLLGRRSVSVVSEYERGVKTPPLPIALKLQLIYQTPLGELFPALQSLASAEVASVREKRPYMAEREKSVNNLPGSENA